MTPAPLKLSRRLLAAAALAAVTPAMAQPWPSRPIRLLVPFPAGGSTDLVARALAEPVAGQLIQSVIVDNRSGAGGLLGSEQVARAPADGYTLLMGGGQNVLLAALGQARGWDPVADFTPVAIVADIPNVLATRANSRLRSVADVVREAKAKPGSLTYASAGIGSASHLVGELFVRNTGTSLVHVPYRGNQPALNDLLGGQVDLMFSNLAGTLSFMGDGNLRIIALTGAQRTSLAPEVPTFLEQGVRGLEAGVWMGLLAPKGTETAVVERVSLACNEALSQPEVVARLRNLGADPAYARPPAFAARMAAELAQWQTVVREAQVRVD
jgi:tripartite-type tricarboxylate transporter receptor subunit TctC